MIPQGMLPRALRRAPVEAQLSYLRQRRQQVERLLVSLEKYARQMEEAPAESRGGSVAGR
jgi:hypothetical protein